MSFTSEHPSLRPGWSVQWCEERDGVSVDDLGETSGAAEVLTRGHRRRSRSAALLSLSVSTVEHRQGADRTHREVTTPCPADRPPPGTSGRDLAQPETLT